MVHAFGDCELDEALFQLRVQGRPVKVEPKVFDVLLFLLRHRDRVVTKDDLMDAVWPGEAVSESVLPHCIAAARRALGDDRAGQRVIRTVHGRGYRFVAEVRTRADGAHATPEGVARPAERSLFVGREAALARLRAGLEAALAGTGGTLLLVGEPGIGKTRTAQEIAAEAEARGARVVWGRALEAEGAPAFWPWIQVLRGSARDPLAAPSAAELGAEAELLAPLLAPPSGAAPSAAMALDAGSEALRFRLFDAVTMHLLRSARERPLVVVLDDLHWADPPSLRLVEFLAPELRAARLLLVGTFRDVELRRGHPLARLLGALAREPSCERIVLRGLGPDETARIVEAIAGTPGRREIVATVHEMTEGNPFFVQEIARLLAERGGLDASEAPAALALPQSVRDAIGRRLDALSPECNDALRAASVLGREFGARELSALLGEPLPAVLDRLAEADAAGVVAEAEDGLGRFAFRHALLRQTLYDEIPTPKRVALHRRAGLALEETLGPELESHLSALAYHFYEAAPGGDVERAIDYAKRAAAVAMRQYAYEEAARHLERALEAEALLSPPDDARRSALLLALGDAQSAAGDRDLARVAFQRAASLARRSGDAIDLARAAIGHKGLVEMGLDEDAGPLLEEALARIGDAAPAWRSRILSRLVGTPSHSDTMARRETLSREAYDLARASGDDVALVDALSARYWACLGPDRPRERLAVTAELRDFARRTGDLRAAVIAEEGAFGAHLVLGDRAGVEASLAAWERVATDLRQPGYIFLVYVARASWALTQGRFAEATTLLDRALERGRHTVPYAPIVHAGHRVWLAYSRGDAPDFDAAGELIQALLAIPGFRTLARCAVALPHLYRSDAVTGRRMLDELAAKGFTDLERDEHWLLAMGILTDTILWLDDAPRAAQLCALLEPYAELMLSHDLMRAVSSSVAGALGALTTLLERYDEAEDWLARASVKAEGLGAAPAGISARVALARLLLRRGKKGDAARAAEVLAEAEAVAAALGMNLAGRHPWLAAELG